MDDDLDLITRELADLQRQLLDLPTDAFAARHELLKQRDRLRERAQKFHVDQDAGRTDEELLRELAARRSQLEALQRQRIDLVGQHGGGGEGDFGGAAGWGGVSLNHAIDQGRGTNAVRARIGVIKGILGDRGVDVPGP